MRKILCDTLWTELEALGKRSTHSAAAVAYVSDDSRMKFGRNDTLVTDASEQAIKSGETSARVLQRAYRRGASLFSFPGLHAKVFAFDRAVVIGSANVSRSSADHLVEAAILSDDVATVSMVRLFLERVKGMSQPISPAFLRRALSLPVTRRGRGSRRRVRVPIVGSQTQGAWLINVHPLDDSRYSDEQRDVEKGTKVAERQKARKSSDVSWIRWSGRDRFRSFAMQGDTVIQIWKEAGKKRPTAVYRHATILHR